MPRRPDALGQQVEAPVRTTADLDGTRARREPDPVEERARLLGELLRLALQTRLLGVAVAEY